MGPFRYSVALVAAFKSGQGSEEQGAAPVAPAEQDEDEPGRVGEDGQPRAWRVDSVLWPLPPVRAGESTRQPQPQSANVGDAQVQALQRTSPCSDGLVEANRHGRAHVVCPLEDRRLETHRTGWTIGAV